MVVASEFRFPGPRVIFFDLGDSAGMNVECPWRLLRKDSIAVSSDDHHQCFGLTTPINAADTANSLIGEIPIQKAEVREGTADVLIDFGANFRLEIIPFSSGYESWQLTAPHGEVVIAQGGGQLCIRSRCPQKSF